MTKVFKYIFFSWLVATSVNLWAMEEDAKDSYFCFKVEAQGSLINASLKLNIEGLIEAMTILFKDAATNCALVAVSSTRDQVCIITEAAKKSAIETVSDITQSAQQKACGVASNAWDLSTWPLRRILGLLLRYESMPDSPGRAQQ